MLHLSSKASHIPDEGHHRSSNCTGLGRNYHRPMSVGLIGLDKFPLLKSHRTATGFSKLFEVHQPSRIIDLHRRLIPQTSNQPIQQCAQYPRPNFLEFPLKITLSPTLNNPRDFKLDGSTRKITSFGQITRDTIEDHWPSNGEGVFLVVGIQRSCPARNSRCDHTKRVRVFPRHPTEIVEPDSPIVLGSYHQLLSLFSLSP